MNEFGQKRKGFKEGFGGSEERESGGLRKKRKEESEDKRTRDREKRDAENGKARAAK